MRFNAITTNLLEIDDEVIEDYIESRDEKDYSVGNFLNFLTTEYYIEDFVEKVDESYTLEKAYFLDEINRVKDQMNND